MEVLFIILQNHDIQFNNNSLSLRDISSVTETSPFASPYVLGMKYIMLHPSYRETRHLRRARGSHSGREKRRGKNSFQERAEEPLGADPY